MAMKYRLGANLGQELAKALDEWQKSFEGYYRECLTDEIVEAYDDPMGARRLRDHLKLLHAAAPDVFLTVSTLRFTEGAKSAAQDLATRLTPGEHAGGKRSQLLNLSEPFTDRLDIELAREFLAALREVAGLSERGKRVWLVLMAAALEQPLSDLAAAYLARAARLLLFGFDVECLVMCRAVLEAALGDVLDPADLDRLGVRRSIKKPDGDDEFSLADLIYGALKCGRFDKDEWELAKQIKQDGNDVLHVNPGLGREAPVRVYQLSLLLRRLYPYTGATPEARW